MAEGFFGTTEGTSVLRWLAMEFHVPGGPIAPSGMKKHGPPPWLTNNVRNGAAIVPGTNNDEISASHLTFQLLRRNLGNRHS